MCSGRGDRQLRLTGFPIRKSPDQSLVAGSPGLIAGSNVLHRLLVPRHPPCALINLTLGTTCYFCRKQKMLASTMQFSRYGRNHASGPPIREARPQAARVSALEKRLPPQDPTVCSAPRSSPALVPRLPGGGRTNRVVPTKGTE